MSDLDELKEKRERLLLEREIAKLERMDRAGSFLSSVHFRAFSVGCAVISFVSLLSVGNTGLVGVLFAVIFIFPLLLHLFLKGGD